MSVVSKQCAAARNESSVDRLPRVLVLTREIPQSVNAGSQQLYRVLQGYPSERLLVLGPAPAEGAQTLSCRYLTLELPVNRWVNTRLHEWVNLANALGCIPDYSRAGIDRLVGGFQPDVVFTVMDLFSTYKIAWRYARDRGLPLVTLTMDDPMHFQRVASWARSVQARAVRRIYRDAAMSLGVSREMSEWIGSRFGKKTETFYFGPPDGMSPRLPDTNRELRNPQHLTVGFAGSLHFYGRELQRLMPAFEQTGTKLNFYGETTRDLPRSAAVVERGIWKIENLWQTIQAECDVLILPYPGKGWLENVFRTHFPTKLSEYLWQGMPLIITGPEYATGLRWGLGHPSVCKALVEPDADQMAALLISLKSDHDSRVKLGVAAARTAKAEFDPVIVREAFKNMLSSVWR